MNWSGLINYEKLFKIYSMKKVYIFLISFIISEHAFTQKTAEPTNQFTVMGLVSNPVIFSISDLKKEKISEIGDFKVTNHLGEFKKEYKNVKGVKLIDLLKNINITASSPKVLSEYYLVCKASDDYTVVISWNELFNTEIGDSFFIVLEADNKSHVEASERILLIATKDFKTGRRHIKGLKSIEVKRI